MKTKGCLQAVKGLILLGLMCVPLWYFISWVWQVFAAIRPEIAVAIVAGAGTIVVSVLSVVMGKYYERRQTIEQELREKKIPAYYEFVELWFSIAVNKPADAQGAEQEERQKRTVELLKTFTQKLMVWGSDDVVAKWSRLRRRFAANEQFGEQMLFEFEELLLAIRRDTGHSNSQLKRGDLLGLFVNDIDKVLAEETNSRTAQSNDDQKPAESRPKTPILPSMPFAAYRRDG